MLILFVANFVVNISWLTKECVCVCVCVCVECLREEFRPCTCHENKQEDDEGLFGFDEWWTSHPPAVFQPH